MSRPSGARPVGEGATGDLQWVHLVLTHRFPADAARVFLLRALGNPVRVRLVEAERGERIGVVRGVEILHADGRPPTLLRARRRLPGGQPAGRFALEHRVRVEVVSQGPGPDGGILDRDDVLVLHVPVHSYLRFLPEVLRGEGPVTVAEGAPRAAGDAPAVDEGVDPLRRLLLALQHLSTTVTDQVDRLDRLVSPARCDPKLLPWLASWFGLELDASLPIHQQRELVSRAIQLYRARGTRRGIEELVRVLTNAPARLGELTPPRPMALGQAVLSGDGHVVGRFLRGEDAGCFLRPARVPAAAHVELVLGSREALQERFGARTAEVLRRIVEVVDAARPAHVRFTVRFEAAEGGPP